MSDTDAPPLPESTETVDRWTPPPALRRNGRLIEIAVAVAALVLNAWNLSINGYGNAYYAAAARSMTTSWHNFIYGSYDAGGFITPDKPPFALWIQAASAKVFGYSSWSLLMPSAIAGALAVWLVMITVRRVWGRTAGISAGIALALTPMMFAVARSSNPDAILVLMIVASAWATERAIATNRLRWSVTAGALVGLGFLTKMLAAAVILPALGLAIAFGIRATWKRQAAHIGVIGAAFVAVSGAWVALMDLSSNSPFVGGSTDGSAWNLVFGYNGFGRVFGNEGGGGPGGGGPGGGGGGRPGGFGRAGGVDQFGGTPGIGRLFNIGMGDQVMWLSLIAAVSLVAGIITAIRRQRRDPEAGSLALFGGWALLTYMLFAFSKGIFHNYYVSALAPALAALVGIGVGQVLRGGRTARLVAAGSVLGTAVLEVILLRRVDAFQWLRIVVPIALVLVAAALVVWAFNDSMNRWRYVTIGAGLASGLIASMMWIGSGMTHAQTATFPDARPAIADTGFGGAGGFPGGFGGATIDSAVLDYLRATTTTEKWILAVGSSMQADSAIIDGYTVMSMGGFSGGDPAMSAERLAGLVRSGQLRYVSGGGGGFGGGPGGGAGGGASSGVTTWVSTACTAVDLSAVGDGTSSAVIYDCRGKADAILEASKSAPTTAGAGTGNGTPPIGNGSDNRPGGVDIAALQECMVANGVDASTVQGGRPNFNDPAVQKAMQACSQYLPTGGPGGAPTGGQGRPPGGPTTTSSP